MAEHDGRNSGDGDAMNDGQSDWMRARLAELEGKNGALRSTVRLLSLGMVIVFAAVAALGWQSFSSGPEEDTGVIEATSVVLKDDNGVARAELGLGADGAAMLALRDQNQIDRLLLTVRGGGAPGLAFADQEGRRRIVLGLLADETGNMVFADGEGTMRAVLGLSDGDGANLVFADQGGVPRVGLGVDTQGLATVMLPSEEDDSSSDGGDPPGVEE